MEIIGLIILYFMPLLICAICFGVHSTAKAKYDLRHDSCLSVGTLLFILFGVAVTLTPGANLIGAAIWLVHASVHYDYEIRNFMEQPVCFWRKEA